MLDILIKRYADGNQRKFAEMLQLPNPQSITDWKKRGINSLDNIERIYRRFGDDVSAEWLITGEGEPFKQSACNNKNSTVVGNNVNGNGIHINNSPESKLATILHKQLAEKDRQIAELINRVAELTQLLSSVLGKQ